MVDIDYHIIKRALSGWEDECGDTGVVMVYDDHCFLALIDVLGHGKDAHKIALVSERYLSENYRLELTAMMNGLHEHLKGTRGAVATLCRIDLADGRLCYVGIGNICTRLLGAQNLKLIPRDGIVGYMISAPKEQELQLYHGDTLVLSSDGVREHVNFEDYPSLLKGSARDITTNLLDLFGKDNDDASCIVLRYGI
ncbi:MAG: SpoIIE family protein phosphatase [Desulfamplus sp.]|nr:SpoIIE family protein phosphatase [Desulfamplus sp.]